MTRISDPGFRLRDHHAPPRFPEPVKLGAQLGTHKPKLKLGDYLDAAVAAPPPAVHRPHDGFAWGMLANDQLGDCVIAMMLHSIEDFHLDAGTPPPAFTDQDAIAMYSAIAGYDPHDPSTDQGTNEATAMSYWQTTGLATSDGQTHKIAGTVAVDPANLTECRIAINEFVDLQIGIDLPRSAQGQPEWGVVGDPAKDPASLPGSWGGHGIPFREYDPATFKCVTWGGELLLTVEFHQAYVSEAHVVVTQEMLNNNSGVGPSGVAWDDLLSDLLKLPPVQ